MPGRVRQNYSLDEQTWQPSTGSIFKTSNRSFDTFAIWGGYVMGGGNVGFSVTVVETGSSQEVVKVRIEIERLIQVSGMVVTMRRRRCWRNLREGRRVAEEGEVFWAAKWGCRQISGLVCQREKMYTGNPATSYHSNHHITSLTQSSCWKENS